MAPWDVGSNICNVTLLPGGGAAAGRAGGAAPHVPAGPPRRRRGAAGRAGRGQAGARPPVAGLVAGGRGRQAGVALVDIARRVMGYRLFLGHEVSECVERRGEQCLGNALDDVTSNIWQTLLATS